MPGQKWYLRYTQTNELRGIFEHGDAEDVDIELRATTKPEAAIEANEVWKRISAENRRSDEDKRRWSSLLSYETSSNIRNPRIVRKKG